MKHSRMAIVMGGILLLVILFLAFNQSFHATIARRKAIRKIKSEIETVDHDIKKIKEKTGLIKDNPQVTEEVVRTELGYIKSGEKDIRFINKPKE